LIIAEPGMQLLAGQTTRTSVKQAKARQVPSIEDAHDHLVYTPPPLSVTSYCHAITRFSIQAEKINSLKIKI
jgi:hypothetical protein